MRPLTDALFMQFRRLDGMRVRGFLSTPALTSTKDKVPFRILTVKNPCFVKPSDTLHGPNGEKMILLEHPSESQVARSFKVAYAFQAFPWKRPAPVLDPVTGLPKDTGDYQDMGLVFANLDTPVDVATLGLTETEYRFITGNDVRVKDHVGTKIVSKVVPILGARIVYAS